LFSKIIGASGLRGFGVLVHEDPTVKSSTVLMSFENFRISGLWGFGFWGFGPRRFSHSLPSSLLNSRLPNFQPLFPWAHNTAITNHGRDFGTRHFGFSGLRYPGVHDAVTPNPLSLQLSNSEISIYFILRAHSTAIALNQGGVWHVQEGPRHLQ
jgi:hypothetical protein